MLLCLSQIEASLNDRLGILVHRIKGTRSKTMFDPCDLMSVNNLVKTVYRNLPLRIKKLDEAYVFPTVFLRQQALTFNDFAQFLMWLKNAKGIVSGKYINSAFAAAKKAFLTFNGSIRDELDPYFISIKSEIIAKADLQAWEKLEVDYWSNIESVLRLVSALTVNAALATFVPYGRAIAAVFSLHEKLMTSSEEILRKASLVVLVKTASSELIPNFLEAHRKASSLFLEALSNVDSVEKLVNHMCIIQALNTYLEGFRNCRLGPDWIAYLKAFYSFSGIWKALAGEALNPRAHRKLVRRQVEMMKLLPSSRK